MLAVTCDASSNLPSRWPKVGGKVKRWGVGARTERGEVPVARLEEHFSRVRHDDVRTVTRTRRPHALSERRH